MIHNANNNQDLLLELRQTALNLQRRVDTLEQSPDLGKDVFNSEEAALFLGMTRSQLYKLTYQRAIPFYKPTGKLVIFLRQELIEWVKSSRVATTTEVEGLAQSHLQRLAMV